LRCELGGYGRRRSMVNDRGPPCRPVSSQRCAPSLQGVSNCNCGEWRANPSPGPAKTIGQAGDSIAILAPSLYDCISKRARDCRTLTQALPGRRWTRDIHGGLSLPVLVEYVTRTLWDQISCQHFSCNPSTTDGSGDGPRMESIQRPRRTSSFTLAASV
jgi:hypothetical protein